MNFDKNETIVWQSTNSLSGYRIERQYKVQKHECGERMIKWMRNENKNEKLNSLQLAIANTIYRMDIKCISQIEWYVIIIEYNEWNKEIYGYMNSNGKLSSFSIQSQSCNEVNRIVSHTIWERGKQQNVTSKLIK